MAENLKTTKYNDGTVIPNVTDQSIWDGLTTDAFCWYKNDISNKTTYGALYNWYSVSTGKLAPTGWHVPTYNEWKALTDYYDTECYTGGKLKETGTSHWRSPNNGATNESGFTALPGGLRCSSLYNGFTGLYENSNFWSNTQVNGYPSKVWYTYLYSNDDCLYINYNDNKMLGLSVRCIKD